MTSPKPIIFFGSYFAMPVVGKGAVLFDVQNHPVHGEMESAHTSTVEDIRDGGNTIETRNTIYKKMEG